MARRDIELLGFIGDDEDEPAIAPSTTATVISPMRSCSLPGATVTSGSHLESWSKPGRTPEPPNPESQLAVR